jgi:predicted enzyme related to lactoylglutathione lyase
LLKRAARRQVAHPNAITPSNEENSLFPQVSDIHSPMIKGVHTMFYTSKPDELRAFLRDKLELPWTDVGEGWLIFDCPEAEMGCHPADPGQGSPAGTHNISFYCDDIEATVKRLKGRGVEFVDEVADHGYGLVTHFKMPGGVEVQLYQPRYKKNIRERAAG